MQPALARNLSALVIASCLPLCGCQSETSPGPAPYGPGVATSGDLRPWLADAKPDTRAGYLFEFNVASMKGSYYTWGLATTPDTESVEVDIRACRQAAEQLRGKQAIVEGRLIVRQDYHRSLLVASRIIPADGVEGVPSGPVIHQEAEAGRTDSITGQGETPVVFQPEIPAVAAVDSAGK